MKAKITSNIFFNRDFAFSFFSKSIGNFYLLSFAIFIFSASVNAQVGELRNGRNIITTQNGNDSTAPSTSDQPGLTPFSIGAKRARIQLLYL